MCDIKRQFGTENKTNESIKKLKVIFFKANFKVITYHFHSLVLKNQSAIQTCLTEKKSISLHTDLRMQKIINQSSLQQFKLRNIKKKIGKFNV